MLGILSSVLGVAFPLAALLALALAINWLVPNRRNKLAQSNNKRSINGPQRWTVFLSEALF